MAEENKEIVIVDDKTIQEKIYLIREQKVMLDADLAEIYGYETKNFNRQVKNNIEKFEGEDFMFQLTENEFENLRCKNFTSSWGGSRYLPNAFTEQGLFKFSNKPCYPRSFVIRVETWNPCCSYGFYPN